MNDMNLEHLPISQYDYTESEQTLLTKDGYHIGIGRWNDLAKRWMVEGWGITWDQNWQPDGFYKLNQPTTLTHLGQLTGNP